MYKQIIIARKDLNMSAGKLAAQACHASMAFLLNKIRDNHSITDKGRYLCDIYIYKDVYEQWLDGEYTKVILQAKNKSQIEKAIQIAKDLNMIEGEDYFIIRDNCHTELEPEEDGKTLTCIGFAPMDSEVIDQIGRKFHTYIG